MFLRKSSRAGRHRASNPRRSGAAYSGAATGSRAMKPSSVGVPYWAKRNQVAARTLIQATAASTNVMDMLSVIGKQFHATQQLVRLRAARNPNEIIEKEMTVGDRLADAVASFGGSWSFIITFGVVLVGYTALNLFLGPGAWDPYPFILLNLFLSMLAAIQAPFIMMSQNRQDAKDRLRGELDFEVNRRAESEVQSLSRKLNLVVDKMDDLEELLRNSKLKT